jgi:hypothetical protein
VEPQDALLVINYLSDPPVTAGEGEAASAWDSARINILASCGLRVDGSASGRAQRLDLDRNGGLASRLSSADAPHVGKGNDQYGFRRAHGKEAVAGPAAGTLASTIDDIAADVCLAWVPGGPSVFEVFAQDPYLLPVARS